MSTWNRNQIHDHRPVHRRVARAVRERVKGFLATTHPHPILVLGNQKSGTSAIGALLGKATGLDVQIDFFYRLNGVVEEKLYDGSLTMQTFAKRYAHWFSKPIVKEPGLTFLADQLREVFPESPLVFVVRDPRENIRSIFNRLNLPGDLPDMTDEHFRALPNDIWRSILDGRSLGVQGQNYVETQAKRWVRAVELYRKYENEAILIRYEDFRADKPAAISQLAGELGLEAPHDITPHMNRQYQPGGDHSVTPRDFFGQENYDRINRIVGETARELGYTAE